MSCSCLCPIHGSQGLSQVWRCSWSNVSRCCSNYIWVFKNFIAYLGMTYIRGLRVGSNIRGLRVGSNIRRLRVGSTDFTQMFRYLFSLWNLLSHINGLVQDCSISIASTLEILRSCTMPSTPGLGSNTYLYLYLYLIKFQTMYLYLYLIHRIWCIWQIRFQIHFFPGPFSKHKFMDHKLTWIFFINTLKSAILFQNKCKGLILLILLVVVFVHLVWLVNEYVTNH